MEHEISPERQLPTRLLHTVKETQEALRISHATTWRLIAVGTLKTVRIGRRRFVTDESLNAVARSGAPTPGQVFKSNTNGIEDSTSLSKAQARGAAEALFARGGAA